MPSDFTDEQITRLYRLFCVQSYTGQTGAMIHFMAKELLDAGCTVINSNGQLLALKGNQSEPVPFYVAHADTVFPIVPDNEREVIRWAEKDKESGTEKTYWYAQNAVSKRAMGLGGDDKCGLFVCLEAARQLDNVGIIITIDEEIGCIGAGMLTRADLQNAAVVIQADRLGWKDAVAIANRTPLSSHAWRKEVQPIIDFHGYEWCWNGLMTDVQCLKANGTLDVCAVNISAGYYRPHEDEEYVCEEDLEYAVLLALALGRASAGKRWAHTIPKHTKKHDKRAQRTTPPDNRWKGHQPNSGQFWDKHLQRTETPAVATRITPVVRIDDDSLEHDIQLPRYVVGMVESLIWPQDNDPQQYGRSHYDDLATGVWRAMDGIDFGDEGDDWDDWKDEWDEEIKRRDAVDAVNDDWADYYVPCSVPSCDVQNVSLDNYSGLYLCRKHYIDLVRLEGRNFSWSLADRDRNLCSLPDCEAEAIAGGLCDEHNALYDMAFRGADYERPEC